MTHTRAFSGNDLSVKVNGSPEENIAAVTVTYDGFELEGIELAPGTEAYERIFSQAGEAGPGTGHTLNVVARDACGKQHGAVASWTDQQ